MAHKIKGRVGFCFLLLSEVELKYQLHLLKQLVYAEEIEMCFAFKFLVFLIILVRSWDNLSSKQADWLLLLKKNKLDGLRQV